MNKQTTNPGHWEGTQYSKNSQLQYKAAMALLHAQTLRGDENILDVGCGDGKITKEIALMVPKGHVLGIDMSPSMLQLAEQQSQIKNTTYQLQDAAQLNFEQQFDLVTSFFCLQWVPNKLAAFQGIYRSLKSGGHVLAIMPTVGPFAEAPNEIMTEPRWQKYFNNYSDPLADSKDTKYDVYAKQAGLHLSAYRIEPTTTIFPSVDAICNFLRIITPHISRLPTEQEKNDFIRAAVDHYLTEVPPAADGSCQFTFNRIELLANRPK